MEFAGSEVATEIMSEKNTAVFGIYHSVTQAEDAVERLMAFGFPQDSISMLVPSTDSTRELAHERNTKAPEGTTTGVVAGGAIGGALAVLVGVGVIAIPGLGPLIAAGPIVAALAGLGAGGTVGGIIGALVGMGIPEYEAKRYEGHLRDGGILLSVHCATSDQVGRAKDLLRLTGAMQISSTGEKGADYPAERPVEVRR